MERTWIAIDEAFQASQQTVPVWNREDENSASHHTSANTRQRTSHIVKKLPEIRDFLPKLAFAINREYVKPDAILRDGDELALLPPVSGG